MADVADAVPTRRVRNAVLARTRHSMCGWVREGSQTDSGFCWVSTEAHVL